MRSNQPWSIPRLLIRSDDPGSNLWLLVCPPTEPVLEVAVVVVSVLALRVLLVQNVVQGNVSVISHRGNCLELKLNIF